jgi:adenosylhomocysteine nucleosidase
MLCLVTALYCEAKPLLDHYSMKRDMTCASHQLFWGDDICLIVSGIGKIKAAIATTRLLSSNVNASEAIAVNIGIGGGAEEHRGKLFLGNKIIDGSSRRTFHPDLLVRTPIQETFITTHDFPVITPATDSGLVDMEASGFCEAASAFLAPNQILCLKVVSDSCNGEVLSKDTVEELVGIHIITIDEILGMYREPVESKKAVFTETDEAVISDLIKENRLTVSQGKQLREWAKAFKVRTNRDLTPLREFSGKERTKTEGKKVLEDVRIFLTTA